MGVCRLLARGVLVTAAVSWFGSDAIGADKGPLMGPERLHPSGAFTFRAPEGWSVKAAADDPDGVDVTSPEEVVVRFVYHAGELSFDAFHALCVMQRMPEQRNTDPHVHYEYDNVDGILDGRHTMDSAFVMESDAPVRGYKKWHQRTLSIVGRGQSLCIVTRAPTPAWKGKARTATDAVLKSLKFSK
jgi:hypothetical protein